MPKLTDAEYARCRDLDKQIGQKLGYHIAPVPVEDHRYKAYPYALHTPGGVDIGAAETPEQVWMHVPTWSMDIRRAFELLDGLVFQLHNQWGVMDDWGTQWVCTIVGSGYYSDHAGAYDTPALAMCQAWMQWKELRATQ